MPGVGYPIEIMRGVPVVAAPAEIDVGNADWLRTVLLEAACRGHATFVVDMTGTQFCASAGLSVLVRAHKRAVAEGAELPAGDPRQCRGFAPLRAYRDRPRDPELQRLGRGPGTGTCRRCPATAPAAAPQAGDAPRRGPAASRFWCQTQPRLTVTGSGARACAAAGTTPGRPHAAAGLVHVLPLAVAVTAGTGAAPWWPCSDGGRWAGLVATPSSRTPDQRPTPAKSTWITVRHDQPRPERGAHTPAD
jgi:anti-anti-sigma factor